MACVIRSRSASNSEMISRIAKGLVSPFSLSILLEHDIRALEYAKKRPNAKMVELHGYCQGPRGRVAAQAVSIPSIELFARKPPSMRIVVVRASASSHEIRIARVC